MGTARTCDTVDFKSARLARIAKQEKARKERVSPTGTNKPEPFSQEYLASRIGVTQSQVSRFENGYPNVIGAEKLAKLSNELEPEYSEIFRSSMQSEAMPRTASTLAFCRNWECPAAVLYVINGQILVRPRFLNLDVNHLGRCGFCDDERLLTQCGHCGSDLHVGVRCHVCGEAFVSVVFSVTQASPDDLQRLCREMNERNRLVLWFPAVGDRQ